MPTCYLPYECGVWPLQSSPCCSHTLWLGLSLLWCVKAALRVTSHPPSPH